MINFFRKIRKKLANENQFSKYSRYAFGEIVLVVLGILIALQLNNWNESRKQEIEFKTTLEQIYSAMTDDAEKLDRNISLTSRQIKKMEVYLNHPDTILDIEYYLKHPDLFEDLPHSLYFIALDFSKYIASETKYHAENLSFNPNNKSQNEIYKHIINHINELESEVTYHDYLNPLYYEYDIASPKININSETNNRYDTLDSLYYTDTDILNAVKLINTNKFRIASKNTRNDKVDYRAKLFNRLGNVESILQLIKSYYPNVKILYQDVGIIGTSLDGFDNVGGKSTPMILTDIENDVWEIDLYLKKGRVKFRCRDSWAQNWGIRSGNQFPKGISSLDGADIEVNEAGNYHIIFKPITGEFEFIKLEE